MNDDTNAAPVLAGILAACQRIVSMDGHEVRVVAEPTDYIVPGRMVQLHSSLGAFRCWIGLNGRRLLFSTTLDKQSPYSAEQNFKTWFDAATRLGWRVHFEVLDQATLSLWADCLLEPDAALVQPATGQSGDAEQALSATGAFWVRDVAMMAQACLRVCERHAIRCSERAPMLP